MAPKPAGVARDRVISDLRGIGDAVLRSTAAQRRITVAHLARQALLSTIVASEPTVTPPGSDSPIPSLSTSKLTRRLPQPHADALIVNAVGLGLSYGEYVARLVNRTPLPRPAAERAADRAALLNSSDQLAVLSADLNAFVRLLQHGSSTEVEKHRHRIEAVDADMVSSRARTSAWCPFAGGQPIARTFCEKATILHAEHHRPPELPIRDRFARHDADLEALWRHPSRAEALARLELLKDVVLHKSRFFASAWTHCETAATRRLRATMRRWRRCFSMRRSSSMSCCSAFRLRSTGSTMGACFVPSDPHGMGYDWG
jgi:hypothetical protein